MDATHPGEMHPLGNPLVFDIIFKHLPFKDQKNCRLASKLWTESSKKKWRSSVILKIDSNATAEGSVGVPVREFLEFVENEGENYFESPFVNIALYEHSKRFWTLCGPTIKHLDIRGYKEILDHDVELGLSRFSRDKIFDFTSTLQTLIISEEGMRLMTGETSLSKTTQPSLINCKDLTIYPDLLEVETLQKVMDFLPDVQKLKMALDNKTFTLVCERWVNLKSMEITGIRLDDCGITGLEIEDVIPINVNRETGFLPSSWPSLRRKPNITGLKYLKKISIVGIETSDRIEKGLSIFIHPFFGYCAGVCGFLQVSGLMMDFQNCLLDERNLLGQYGTACQKINYRKGLKLL